MSENKEVFSKLYKGIGIMLYLIANMLFIDTDFANIINAVCIPMLFIASVTTGESESGNNHLVKSFRYYMIPYFIFSFIYFVIDLIQAWAAGDNITFVVRNDLIDSFSLYGISLLWYLPAIFIGENLYFYVRKYINFVFTFIIFMLLILVCVLYMTDVSEYMEAENGIVLSFAFRLFTVCWRGTLAGFLMAVGEFIKNFANEFQNKKIIVVVLAIFFILLGYLILAQNGITYFEMLKFNNAQLYFVGTIMFCGGIYFLIVWIGRSSILNFFANNARNIYLTYKPFLIMDLSFGAGNFVLDIFDNSFMSKLAIIILVSILEFIIIFFANKISNFLQGN